MRQDNLEVGKSLLNLAIVDAVGDFYTSEATALEALNYFQSPQAIKYRQRVYNNLAVITIHMKKYKEGLAWYRRMKSMIESP